MVWVDGVATASIPVNSPRSSWRPANDWSPAPPSMLRSPSSCSPTATASCWSRRSRSWVVARPVCWFLIGRTGRCTRQTLATVDSSLCGTERSCIAARSSSTTSTHPSSCPCHRPAMVEMCWATVPNQRTRSSSLWGMAMWFWWRPTECSIMCRRSCCWTRWRRWRGNRTRSSCRWRRIRLRWWHVRWVLTRSSCHRFPWAPGGIILMLRVSILQCRRRMASGRFNFEGILVDSLESCCNYWQDHGLLL